MKKEKCKILSHCVAYINAAKRLIFLHFSFLILLSSLSAAGEPFFVTIQKVELKNASGRWVEVIEPDRRVDLTTEEPTVSFFNNGRIAPDDYLNVRVSLLSGEGVQKKVFLERQTDYIPALSVRKGSFVSVSFEYDPAAKPMRLASETVRQVSLTVDDQVRLDPGEYIKIWS